MRYFLKQILNNIVRTKKPTQIPKETPIKPNKKAKPIEAATPTTVDKIVDIPQYLIFQLLLHFPVLMDKRTMRYTNCQNTVIRFFVPATNPQI